jgi:hypothetical protein
MSDWVEKSRCSVRLLYVLTALADQSDVKHRRDECYAFLQGESMKKLIRAFAIALAIGGVALVISSESMLATAGQNLGPQGHELAAIFSVATAWQDDNTGKCLAKCSADFRDCSDNGKKDVLACTKKRKECIDKCGK